MLSVVISGKDPAQLDVWERYVLHSLCMFEEMRIIRIDDPSFGPTHPQFEKFNVQLTMLRPETVTIPDHIRKRIGKRRYMAVRYTNSTVGDSIVAYVGPKLYDEYSLGLKKTT